MTDTIKKSADELILAIQAGRRTWTTAELLPYIQDLAGGSIDTARSRAAAVARTLAYGMRVNLDDTVQGRFVFGEPPAGGDAIRVIEKLVEVPVEKVVEKIVRVPAEGSGGQDLQVHLKFPEEPATAKANPKYEVPDWYLRMQVALDAGKHVALKGPPGTGKSSAPEQYFIKRGQPFVVVNGDAGFRRRDVEGSVEIQAGTTFFKVAEFAAAAVNGWGCILNEVNAADPDALLWINGILEVPNMVTIHGKAYPVHPEFKLIVTYNPGLVGTKALPQAFLDRFLSIKVAFPGRDFLRRMVIAKTGMDTANRSYSYWLEKLLAFAESAWDAHVKGNLRYQISPRRLFDAVFLLTKGVARTHEDAIKMAIIETVDSAADVQVLERLITGAAPGMASRFGGVNR
jgi:hypothetical protein